MRTSIGSRRSLRRVVVIVVAVFGGGFPLGVQLYPSRSVSRGSPSAGVIRIRVQRAVAFSLGKSGDPPFRIGPGGGIFIQLAYLLGPVGSFRTWSLVSPRRSEKGSSRGSDGDDVWTAVGHHFGGILGWRQETALDPVLSTVVEV